jgi:hypothetical protein
VLPYERGCAGPVSGTWRRSDDQGRPEISRTKYRQPLCPWRTVVKLACARSYRPLPPWQAIGARTSFSPRRRPSINAALREERARGARRPSRQILEQNGPPEGANPPRSSSRPTIRQLLRVQQPPHDPAAAPRSAERRADPSTTDRAADRGQTAGKLRADCGQAAGRLRADCGQAAGRLRAGGVRSSGSPATSATATTRTGSTVRRRSDRSTRSTAPPATRTTRPLPCRPSGGRCAARRSPHLPVAS